MLNVPMLEGNELTVPDINCSVCLLKMKPGKPTTEPASACVDTVVLAPVVVFVIAHQYNSFAEKVIPLAPAAIVAILTPEIGDENVAVLLVTLLVGNPSEFDSYTHISTGFGLELALNPMSFIVVSCLNIQGAN